MKGSDGKIVEDEHKLMDVWRAHYDGISNEEFAWDREDLTNVSPVCGPSERISALEVDAAIGKMKQGKSGGPTGVVSEMLKAAGETDTMWMTDVCNVIIGMEAVIQLPLKRSTKFQCLFHNPNWLV